MRVSLPVIDEMRDELDITGLVLGLALLGGQNLEAEPLRLTRPMGDRLAIEIVPSPGSERFDEMIDVAMREGGVAGPHQRFGRRRRLALLDMGRTALCVGFRLRIHRAARADRVAHCSFVPMRRPRSERPRRLEGGWAARPSLSLDERMPGTRERPPGHVDPAPQIDQI